jgi:hypothetical protein
MGSMVAGVILTNLWHEFPELFCSQSYIHKCEIEFIEQDPKEFVRVWYATNFSRVKLRGLKNWDFPQGFEIG